MVQQIKQGNIWGRVGSGIGQGLAEQIPKEIERSRLSSGLKNFEEDHQNLTPIQQLSRLSAIPGITPQMIQSFSELAKNQASRNAYTRRDIQSGRPAGATSSPRSSPDFRDMQLANIEKRLERPQREQQPSQQNIPSNYRNREEEVLARPQETIKNPLAKELEPPRPWSQDRLEDEVSSQLERDPNLSVNEAMARAAAAEAREMALPVAERKVQEDKKNSRDEIDEEFDKQISTLLQKDDKGVYKDLTGLTLLNLKKSAFDDLETNPKLNARTAAEKWAKKGHDLARTKQDVKVMAHRDLTDKAWPSKKEENLKKLKQAQKIFAETGNANEFFDILRSKNTADTYGFGLSPGAAALIAYPRSERIKEVVRSHQNFGPIEYETLVPKDRTQKSRKFAEEVRKNLTPEDSLLAIAREMRDKNEYFDEAAFFDWFGDHQESLPPHMKNELVKGVSDISPNWGDVALFPFFGGRSAVHD